MPNIFLGTKEKLTLSIGEVVRSIPHGELFMPSNEDDADEYIDNYLITGHSSIRPNINVFVNTDEGYELILKEYIPNWKDKPIDGESDWESAGYEYSPALYDVVMGALFK